MIRTTNHTAVDFVDAPTVSDALPSLYERDDLVSLACPACNDRVDIPVISNMDPVDCETCGVSLVSRRCGSAIWLRTLDEELDDTIVIDVSDLPASIRPPCTSVGRRLADGPFLAGFDEFGDAPNEVDVRTVAALDAKIDYFMRNHSSTGAPAPASEPAPAPTFAKRFDRTNPGLKIAPYRAPFRGFPK